MNSVVSRVFKNGNSQAIRIPAEFRLQADRVRISRNAQGDLVIHPLQENRGAAFLAALEGFDADYLAELECNQQDTQIMQDRELL